MRCLFYYIIEIFTNNYYHRSCNCYEIIQITCVMCVKMTKVVKSWYSFNPLLDIGVQEELIQI